MSNMRDTVKSLRFLISQLKGTHTISANGNLTPQDCRVQEIVGVLGVIHSFLHTYKTHSGLFE